jgi:hypothetical protein
MRDAAAFGDPNLISRADERAHARPDPEPIPECEHQLSRCYGGTEASARAWLEVACVAYLFARLRVVPT